MTRNARSTRDCTEHEREHVPVDLPPAARGRRQRHARPRDYTWSAASTGTFTLIGMYPFGCIINQSPPFLPKDFIYQNPSLSACYDGACVSFMMFVPATTAIPIAQGAISYLWHS